MFSSSQCETFWISRSIQSSGLGGGGGNGAYPHGLCGYLGDFADGGRVENKRKRKDGEGRDNLEEK